MSGHSKWSTTKHKKAITDSKKSKYFTKLCQNIETAAKKGNPDPNKNSALFEAINKAKKASLPLKTIKKAIYRGSEINAFNMNNINNIDYIDRNIQNKSYIYEIHILGGLMVIIDVLTKNKNRISSVLKSKINYYKGRISNSKSVLYLFNKKCIFIIKKTIKNNYEYIFESLLEFQVEEIIENEINFIIIAPMNVFNKITQSLKKSNINYINRMPKYFVAKNKLPFNKSLYKKYQKIYKSLIEIQDVKAVYLNLEFKDFYLNNLIFK